MTTHALAHPGRPLAGRLMDFLVSIGQASEIGRRAAAAERLLAMSDADLANIGLSRDRVLHHAFGPYMAL